jgi:hypothetical protein
MFWNGDHCIPNGRARSRKRLRRQYENLPALAPGDAKVERSGSHE